MLTKVNLEDKFASIDKFWNPYIAGEMDNCYIKLAKLKGEFIWHHHESEDEMFLVIKGVLNIKLRDADIVLKEGEFLIIPRGVEHLPIADREVHVLLLEPKTTINTGEAQSDRTVSNQWI